MSFEITGKLIAKYEEVQRSATFKTREFVIEKTDDINGRTVTNYIKFQCVQDKTTLPDKANIGDDVKVFFNIKGSKWNKNGVDNYITNLDAWRLEAVKLGGTAPMNEMPTETFSNFEDADGEDLPF